MKVHLWEYCGLSRQPAAASEQRSEIEKSLKMHDMAFKVSSFFRMA